MLQEQGLDGVDKAQPESMSVPDYSAQEKQDDENAIDWEMAFNEVEMGEMKKQERINKERDESHKQELERQKLAMEERMRESMSEYENAKMAQEQAQVMERERIEREKKMMSA